MVQNKPSLIKRGIKSEIKKNSMFWKLKKLNNPFVYNPQVKIQFQETLNWIIIKIEHIKICGIQPKQCLWEKLKALNTYIRKERRSIG